MKIMHRIKPICSLDPEGFPIGMPLIIRDRHSPRRQPNSKIFLAQLQIHLLVINYEPNLKSWKIICDREVVFESILRDFVSKVHQYNANFRPASKKSNK
jgi:hypothetical protein